MRATYRNILQTPSVENAQRKAFGRVGWLPAVSDSSGSLGSEEIHFIEARDSFYMATVAENGWPYVQHRGGPAGFLKVVEKNRLCFVDLPGNRQLFSAGNIDSSGKVSLFLMDYPARERLKIIGNARVVECREEPELVEKLGLLDTPDPKLRIFVVEVIGYDWNCPKYITPRYTMEEVQEAMQPLRDRIKELEVELAESG